jgi:Domain of unknown function (DUF1854)
MIAIKRSKTGQPILIKDKTAFENIEIVQAFPIQSDTDSAISILNKEGKELLWIKNLKELDEDSAHIIRDILNLQEIHLKIESITSISSKLYPCTWSVETRKGSKIFTIENEEDFIQLHHQLILIKSQEHIYYVLKDLHEMDKKSLQHLMPFIFHV